MLRYFAALRGLEGLGEAATIAARLELDLDVRIRSYSSGNRRKVALVQAFMHRPELLLLDEPTSSLDPLVQQEFYAMIDEVRADGRTVFLSSHVLHEVERIADRVAIIRRGRLVVVDSVAAIKERAVRRLELRFASPVAAEHFARLPSVIAAESTNGGTAVRVSVAGSIDAVIKTAAGFDTVSVVADEGDLEDAFLTYYQDEESADAG
jgi:ABC-2 type transport system ATP-binding protein